MPNAAKILLIEADESLSRELFTALEGEGFKPQAAKNRAQAAALLRSLKFDAVVSEVRLPDGDIEPIYRDALPYLGSTPVIFTATSANLGQAVRLLKIGAVDYLQKPFDFAALIAGLRRAITEEASRAKADKWPEPTMVSPAMLELKKRLERLAANTVSALIVGETGSGKEVIARYIHRLSSRAEEPFIVLRGGSLGGADGEQLLVGAVVRSAKDKHHVQAGALELVGKGTLFLDEISELPACLQGKLIQVIESKRFTRIGDLATELPFEGRMLTSSCLSAEKLRERLSPDLVARLAVVEITVPPLRTRKADIAPLVEALLPEVAAELGATALPVETDALAAMRVHDWPGNVRELRNRLVCALSFASGNKIRAADVFPGEIAEETTSFHNATLNDARAEAERQRIEEALTLHQGRVGRAAQGLGISRVTLWAKMKRFGLSPQQFLVDKDAH